MIIYIYILFYFLFLFIIIIITIIIITTVYPTLYYSVLIYPPLCFDCLRRLFIWLLLFSPPPFILFFINFLPPPPSFIPSYTCSFSLSVLRTSYYYVIIFLRHFYQAIVAIKISNFLICFCSFELFCPILEKDNFIENVYLVLSCLNKYLPVNAVVQFSAIFSKLVHAFSLFLTE